MYPNGGSETYIFKFFSIVLPIYNVEKYLNRCIDSILKQGFDDYEIILVDDGSKDSCGQLCDEWSVNNVFRNKIELCKNELNTIEYMSEAIINITLSIALVHRYSIVGVLIATVVALPLKVIYLTWLSDKKILKRSYGKTIIILGVNAALFVITVLLKDYMGIEPTSYGQFVVYGIVLTLVYLTLSTVLNSIANPDVFVFVRNKLKRM